MTEQENIQVQNDQKVQLEQLLKNAKKEETINYLKATGKAILPIVLLGGLGLGTHLITSPLENNDLRQLLNIAIPAVAGGFVGVSGMVEDYIEWFGDTIYDIRDTYSRIKDYTSQLRTLEQKV